MTIEAFPIPADRAPVSLETALYQLIVTNPGHVSQPVAIQIFLIPRLPGIQKAQFYVASGQVIRIDGHDWKEIAADYGTTDIVAYLSPGFSDDGVTLYHYLGPQPYAQYDLPYTSDTIARSLERVVPRNGESSGGLALTEIASGGADLTGNLENAEPGDLIIFMLGISQDALGTSPHASYVQAIDPAGNGMFTVYGAIGGGYSVFYARAGVSGVWTYHAHNGDSVTHYFQCLMSVIHS